jgi:hypothetical protein
MVKAKIGPHQSSYSKLQRLANISLFKSVKVYPSTIAFEGQDTDEQIILFLRQHPIVLVPGLVRSIILFLVGLLITFVFSIITQQLNLQAGASTFVLLTFSIIVGLVNMFFSFLKWYFNVFIITSSRLVDIDFLSLFDARVSSTVLEVIEDVTHSSPGFWSTLFDMGSLTIQTAGEKQEFEITNIPKPRDVQDILMDLIDNIIRNGKQP